MKYCLTMFVVLVVTFLMLSSSTIAGKKHPQPNPPHNWNKQTHKKPVHVQPIAPVTGKQVTTPNYHLKFGTRFKFGYYYTGWNHNHWSYHYWDDRYGCYLYYDPWLECYFYWCAPHYRYYPIVYVPLGYVFPYEAQPTSPETPPSAPPPYVPDTK